MDSYIDRLTCIGLCFVFIRIHIILYVCSWPCPTRRLVVFLQLFSPHDESIFTVEILTHTHARPRAHKHTHLRTHNTSSTVDPHDAYFPFTLFSTANLAECPLVTTLSWETRDGVGSSVLTLISWPLRMSRFSILSSRLKTWEFGEHY